MPATLKDNKANAKLVAFTPRQVLLGMKHSGDNNASSNGTVHLNQEEKLLLHISLAHYFHRCGFSKTLKKFRSEAKIEKDNVETSSVDLEEMCLKYLELCKGAKTNINYQKEQVAGKHLKKDADDPLVAGMDNDAEKKKKKDKSDSDPVHQPGSDKNLEGSKKTNGSNPESEAKSKEKGTDKKKKEKKKKSKLVSESHANSVEDDQVQSESMLTEVKVAETEKKSKDKKKTKKDKLSCDGDAKELHIGDPTENISKIADLEAPNNDVTEKKKDSKKRKRLTSEENDVQLADEKADEDPKRRKIGNLIESKEGEQSANGQVGGDQTPRTYGEQHDKKTNGTNEKFSEKRSRKKPDSVEPSSAKPFQRVKIEKIKYADERLQDNSYWAKDGAETGYGAKAEEILSQVRGRGFRHEKTKKKRGTYRGGQIDLQSHSIKFNYSDDDE
ncbi:suppressor protein SRP40 isoform X2 [Neltuma alba]|uniref:suppressor protein SRP40 isoform X2 n=1 Tax=Neltuma alba TaxID=207710 RepID=UPI0010A3805C|nr:suppressor protein SRP40 isoform X2 [Prosopis alba]